MKRATYLRGARWLSLPLSLIASGCASTPRPAVLDDARGALQSPESRELVALRPAMLEAAHGYGLAAEQAFEKGDVDQARRFAELVLQRVHAAENFVARDAAAEKAKIMATRLANMDKEVDRDRKELTRLQALDKRLEKLVAAAQDRGVATDPAMDNARKQLVAARRKQAEAIGVGAHLFARDKYEEGLTLLEASVMDLEMDLAADSTTATTAAIVAFTAAINSTNAAKAAVTPAVSGTAKERVATGAESIADVEEPRKKASRALRVTSTARGNALDQNAEMARASIRQAEDAKADAIARGTQGSTAMAHGTYLLELADKALADGNDERAMDLAKDARKAFGLATAPQSTTPYGSGAELSEPRAAKVTPTLIHSTPPRAAVAEKTIAKASKERPIKEKVVVVQPIATVPVVEKTVVEKPVVEKTVVEKTVVVVPTAPRPTVDDEPHRDWQEPYRKIIEALTLRDQAKGLATTPATKAALATGMGKLADAELAWKRRDFSAAKELADSAIGLFSTIVSPTTASDVASVGSPLSGDASAQRDSESYRTVESLVREATTLVEVCEHEKCAERNIALFASGKAEATSARVALEAARYEIATELATEAKKKLRTSLETPKSATAAAVDTEGQKKRRIDAEDAIREANVQVQLCEQKKCTGKDIESWLRAESLMGAARAAFADAEFDRAKMKAQEATNIVKAALSLPKAAQHIEIPPDVTNVVARGNALFVTPAFDFTSASSILTKASGPSVDAMAKVLLHNKDRIRSISVIGFTDNRGAPALNESISQQRAKVIADKLIAAGVSAALVTSSGRGPENPMADNATAEGRRANRRVEIRIEFLDDGK